MAQRISVQQFKEAIQVVSKVFKDLGDQREINILPLIGGMAGAGNIHLAIMRMNLLAQQIEADEKEQKEEEEIPRVQPLKKEEPVESRYKAGQVIL